MTATTRELILSALHHEVSARIPTDASFHPEVEQRLMQHFGTDTRVDVEQRLGLTPWVSLSARVGVPRLDARSEKRTVGLLTREGTWQDDRTYVDKWGVTMRIGDSGWYEERVSGPLDDADAEDLSVARESPLPEIDDITEPPDYAQRVRQLKESGEFVVGEIRNPYKDAWRLRGMDNVLADYLIHREFLEVLYDRLYSLYAEIALREIRAGVDMVTMWGDIAMQDRIIMGPDTWREVDRPRMAKLVADCKSENPDVFMFIHSDGNLTDLVGDLVAIGFDVINPLQPECMDPAEVKRRWGDEITIWGGISLQRTLPNGTPVEVRDEIGHLIRTCGNKGGLVATPSNAVQPDTSVENIIACFDAVREYDLSTLQH